MSERWSVRRDAQVFGPYSVEDMQAFRADGRLRDFDQVRCEGETHWVRASTVDRLQPIADQMSTSPPPLPFPAVAAADAGPPASLRGFTVVVIVGVCIHMLLAELWYGYLLATYDAARRGRSSAWRLGDTADNVELWGVFVWVVTGIFFMVWMWRAYRNLGRLGVNRKHAVGWTVGGWFVPLYNLYKPFAIGLDLERGSAKAAGLKPRARWAGWWWFLFIVNAVFTQVLSLVAVSRSPDTFVDMSLAYAISHLIFAVVTIGFLVRVMKCQHGVMRSSRL